MTMAPSKEVGPHFTPWGTFHISVSPVFFEMTENIEWLRLEGASRDHLVHSHLAQAGPPWAHFPGLCPGAFWSPGHPEDLPDGGTGSWAPRTPHCQQHFSQPQQWVQALPWAAPPLAAGARWFFEWFIITGAALAALTHAASPMSWGAHHHKGSVVTNAYHSTCCVEDQLRLEQSRLLRQK